MPWLSGHDGWGPIAGTLTGAVQAYVLPLTRRYGVGAPDGSDDGRHEGPDQTPGRASGTAVLCVAGYTSRRTS